MSSRRETQLASLPGMAYRCRGDRARTMERVSEGCFDLTGYRPAQIILNQEVSYGQLIHPEDRDPLWHALEAALREGEGFRHAYRIVTVGGEVRWVWEEGGGFLSEEGDLLGVEGVIVGIPEQLRAYQSLERRVEERTRELATLLEVSRNVASTLELRPLLELILDQLGGVLDNTGATIFELRGNDLVVLAYRGPGALEEMLQVRYDLGTARAHREVLVSGQPCIIPDVRGDSPMARAFRTSAGERFETTFGYVRSWMGIPLAARKRTIGMLSLYNEQPDCYSPRMAQLALAFANEAAVAIENARLYHQEQERRREAEQRRKVAEGLRDILTTINSNRPLDGILEHVVVQASLLLGSDAVVLYRQRRASETPTIQAASGFQVDPVHSQHVPLGPRVAGHVPVPRQPMVVPDLSVVLPKADGLSGDGPDFGRPCRALLAVPIMIQREVYGGLELHYLEPREFSEEEVQLAVSLADQAALAIDNARLRAQVEQAAVAAERNRLARDLHDAVTQTLFSASLIAEVLPRLWERNPAEGWHRLEELRQLTRGALAEMRALLLELRPTALTEVSLADLLRQLAEAITGRARVPISVEIDGERELPGEVQVALYRIAQEALNNVAKHAGADCAWVELRLRPGGAELRIRDNGCGFDPGEVSAEHLGLGIMGERAEDIGAALTVDSQPGRGTRIAVDWTEAKE